jgi:probable HAF family extracellular repeat protein
VAWALPLAAVGASPALADDFQHTAEDVISKLFLSNDGAVVAGSLHAPLHAFRWDRGVFTDLNGPSYQQSRVFAASADGSVLAGFVNDGTNHPARWDGTTLSLLPLPSAPVTMLRGTALAISADGSTIAGQVADNSTGYAVVWHAGGATDVIGGPFGSAANAISSDGHVIAGQFATSSNGPTHAFRWDGTLQDLDPTSVYSASEGDFISSDGNVVVGRATGGIFRWTTTTPMTLLGGLGLNPIANGISGDGSVVVGSSEVATSIDHAFRWENGTTLDLGVMNGTQSTAKAVSADGKTVVGTVTIASNTHRAFRWTAQRGMEDLTTLLTDGGVDLAGLSLEYPLAVNDDGTVIAGQNSDGTGDLWITHCATICAVTTVTGTAESFSGLGALGATGSTYIAGQFDAAGDMADAGKTNPITGFAYGAFDSDPTTSATIGATYSFGDAYVIGGSVGVAGIETPMPFGGSSTFGGPSATIFVASKPDSGPNWLVGGSLVGLSGTITRGYLNGATPVTSSGNTTGTGAGFTAEAGWTFKDLVANTLVTPFVSLTVSSLSYAGYSETGGPFPASFSALTTTSAVARLGVEARYEFQKHSYLSASLSYGHDFGSGGSIAGAIPGILTLSVPGAAPASDFIEAGLGLDMPLKDNIRLTTHLGAFVPFTGTPSLQARAGVSMAF